MFSKNINSDYSESKINYLNSNINILEYILV